MYLEAMILLWNASLDNLLKIFSIKYKKKNRTGFKYINISLII